jgi:DNA segregation ATPase FtsK/SpoIIIE, S-DNA-T family
MARRTATPRAPARRPKPAPRPRASQTGVVDPFSAFTSLLLRIETLGVLIIAAGAGVAGLALADMPVLYPYGGPPVRALGLGVFAVAGLIGLCGALVALRRMRLSRRGLKLTAGWALLLICVWGTLGFFTSGGTLSGVALRDVTLGGEWGRALTHSTLGVVLWLGSFAGASALLWPHASLSALSTLPPAARTVWSWRIPQRTWRIISDGFRALFDSGVRGGGPSVVVADPPTGTPPVIFVPDEPAVAFELAGVRRKPKAETPEEVTPKTPESVSAWPKPPRDILMAAPTPQEAAQDNEKRARLIEHTLASFGVDSRVVSVKQGPTVTQFGIEPGWEVKTRTVVERDGAGQIIRDRDGKPRTRQEEVSRTRVRVNEITRLANDLALSLAAPAIRIEAPVPGQPVVGIEVPNTNAATVTLRGVLDTPVFQKLGARSKLALALGQGVSGEVVVADLARMPHLLIAGATGSGKSVCINSLIACILMHATPDEVRFVMVDPKRVELTGYEPIPHLALSRVIVDMDEVVGTLGAVISEMEARYRKFAALAVRNLEAYNKHPKVVEPLPQWVVIIDELADLMMAAPFEVEKQICRLAQLARATGIHLVIATQRPSVDVITGLIKANFPTRIAFAVTSQVDSRTILDTGGAEKLLGRGDMLYLATDAAKPRRIQGVYVSDQEIERLVQFWANERFAPMRPPTFDHLVEEAKAATEKDEEDDPLLERARELAQEHTRISTSMLQRRLRIGYPRAARLMDLLEAEGLVGGSEGLGSREVFGGSDDD